MLKLVLSSDGFNYVGDQDSIIIPMITMFLELC